jgi:hypothetical protein
MIKYLKTKDVLTIFVNGEMRQISSTLPQYEAVMAAINNNAEEDTIALMMGDLSYRDNNIEISRDGDFWECFYEGKYRTLPEAIVAHILSGSARLTKEAVGIFLKGVLSSPVGLDAVRQLLLNNKAILSSRGTLVAFRSSNKEALHVEIQRNLRLKDEPGPDIKFYEFKAEDLCEDEEKGIYASKYIALTSTIDATSISMKDLHDMHVSLASGLI